MVKLEIYCNSHKIGELVYNTDSHVEALDAAHNDYPEYAKYPYIIIASNC